MSQTKYSIAVLATALAGLFVVTSNTVIVACTPAARRDVAHAVIDVALATCVAEHPGNDEPTLRDICRYAEDLAPVVRELLAAQKRGAMKSASASCADGGK